MLQVSGLVGLSPTKYEKNADLFIEKFRDEGAIEEAVFSMSIAPNYGQSKMTIGGYDEERFSTTPLTWADLHSEYDTYWRLSMDKMSFKFGDNDEDAWSTHNKQIIIDSGTSFNLMPSDDLKPMLEQIEENMDIQCELDVIPICGCPGDPDDEATIGVDDFPDLKYVMEGETYFIPRRSYVVKQQGTCYLKLMHHPTLPFHIMGLNFFQNYYTVFDQERKRLGFGRSIHADERLDDLYDIYDIEYLTFLERVSSSSQNMTMILGASSLLAIGGYFGYKKVKKNQVKESENKNQFMSM
jgi:hypothetical protein